MSAGTSYGFPGSRDRSNLGDTNSYAAVRFRKPSAIVNTGVGFDRRSLY
jgi:hypothetical protein